MSICKCPPELCRCEHAVAPAVTELAVEAIARVEYGIGWDEETPGVQNVCRDLARKALEAAIPLLGTRHMLDREALYTLLRATRVTVTDEWRPTETSSGQIADAVMKLAQPMPTREQIEEAIFAVWLVHTELRTVAAPVEHCRAFADAVLALLKGGQL